MNATPKATEFLTLKDAATVAGVGYETLRSWIRTGKLPIYGQGKIYRVLLSDILPKRSKRYRDYHRKPDPTTVQQTSTD